MAGQNQRAFLNVSQGHVFPPQAIVEQQLVKLLAGPPDGRQGQVLLWVTQHRSRPAKEKTV